jgi:Zn-dependent M28 family amino/carboxypeptidase
VIVVGAHLDHVGVGGSGVYNGADDNASGSAATLGLAKRFARGTKPCCTIAFQWYTAEEDGLIGSRYYVNNPTLPKDEPSIKKHVFMLNLDMIGRLRKTGAIIIDIDLPPILKKLYVKYPFARGVTLINSYGSDQVSFQKAGVKEAFLHTGLHRDYHRTTDDADKINYKGMEEICDYAYDLINAVIGSEPNYNIW